MSYLKLLIASSLMFIGTLNSCIFEDEHDHGSHAHEETCDTTAHHDDTTYVDDCLPDHH
jgi:hypothetical protein